MSKASKNSYYISLKQFIRRGKSCVINITAINCTTGDRETYGETVESTSCTCVSGSVVCLTSGETYGRERKRMWDLWKTDWDDDLLEYFRCVRMRGCAACVITNIQTHTHTHTHIHTCMRVYTKSQRHLCLKRLQRRRGMYVSPVCNVGDMYVSPACNVGTKRQRHACVPRLQRRCLGTQSSSNTLRIQLVCQVCRQCAWPRITTVSWYGNGPVSRPSPPVYVISAGHLELA